MYQNKYPVKDDEYNYHYSLLARLVEGRVIPLIRPDKILVTPKITQISLSQCCQYFNIVCDYFVATEMCFVVTLSRDVTEEAFSLIKETVSYLIHKYGYLSVNYCLVLRDENNFLSNTNFEDVCVDKTALLKRVEVLQKSKSSPRLFDDLCAARDAFKSPKVRKEAKKVRQYFCGATCKKGFLCYYPVPI